MHLAVLIVLYDALACCARLINYTIDDTNGDQRTRVKPEYSSEWSRYSDRVPIEGPESGVIDWKEVHNATLHGKRGNLFPAFSLSFYGTAIYVFFVVIQVGFLYVYLDEHDQGLIEYDPPLNGSGPVYNHMVFKKEGLRQELHHLYVQTGLGFGYFDYAIYTLDDEATSANETTTQVTSWSSKTSTSSGPAESPTGREHEDSRRINHSNPQGAIIGASLATAVCFLAICSWLLVRRRHRASRTDAPASITMRDGEITAFIPPDDAAPDRRPEKSCKLDEVEATITPLVDLGTAEAETSTPVLKIKMHGGHAESAEATVQPTTQQRVPSPLMIELESVLQENQRVRSELEQLRQVAEPPPYADGGQTEI